ncbi:hypothetical protein PC129_g14780 [Phytophthora cactorum]|uniref:Uncharacterized protein n=1 Tax=Phytophthora cactorum TaxID=29920 RepID=A0A8T1BRU1_9STRA|nr:hypothetical protein PC112_g7022 [Phytophthora cactorum]KAG2847009.1 hypothetical protein PC111_g983 [Phytophthora cactorum]KAG2907464.1 hypothetical protein PC115_g13930 [Phytophthora cactorum]KAG2931774.1 hypothetical protein PC114_g2067 [Phytophthora cactorum]KAG2993438.1 hypothetical protein PC118_g4031 [Phytophthora cactorum]
MSCRDTCGLSRSIPRVLWGSLRSPGNISKYPALGATAEAWTSHRRAPPLAQSRILGLSPIHQLAFVLEKQYSGVQLKLVFWVYYNAQASLQHTAEFIKANAAMAPFSLLGINITLDAV